MHFIVNVFTYNLIRKWRMFWHRCSAQVQMNFGIYIVYYDHPPPTFETLFSSVNKDATVYNPKRCNFKTFYSVFKAIFYFFPFPFFRFFFLSAIPTSPPPQSVWTEDKHNGEVIIDFAVSYYSILISDSTYIFTVMWIRIRSVHIYIYMIYIHSRTSDSLYSTLYHNNKV